MLLIWSRWGAMVPLINFAAFMGYAFALTPFEHKLAPAANVLVTCALAAFFGGGAAVGIYLLDDLIGKRNPARVLVDPLTGGNVTLKRPTGSFFFLPMKTWAFLTIGVWGLVAVLGIMGGDLLR